MSAEGWLSQGEPHVWRPYCQHRTAPPPLAVVGAHGCRLVLEDGRELVDGIASWWTAAHGYNHPHIRARVQEQLQVLPHIAFGGLAHEPAYTLATRLAGLLPQPLRRVFFVESGSVAVEVALKMCMQTWLNRGRARKSRVVSFAGAYHGDTFMTMRLSDPEDGMHAPLLRQLSPSLCLPLPHAQDDGVFEAALREHAEEVACVIVEPLVQCAGGMRFHDPVVLQRMRSACDANDVLLIFDEIATGFHRIGPRFALDEAGVVPDVVTLGKALTGGTLPLACAVASEEIFAAFLHEDAGHALQHGPTYMGNALACAAAHASLDLFAQQDFAQRVSALEHKLREGLAPLRREPDVVDVRVKGGIGVVAMKPGTAPSAAAFAARGAFVRPLRQSSGDVVYLMPPLVIGDRDLAVLFAAVNGALRASRSAPAA